MIRADKQSIENVSTRIGGRFGPGNPGGHGRPAGVPNRWTRGSRAAFQMAFDRLGGVDGLVDWGRKHPGDFYRLYARLTAAEPAIAVLDVTPELASDPLRMVDGR